VGRICSYGADMALALDLDKNTDVCGANLDLQDGSGLAVRICGVDVALDLWD